MNPVHYLILLCAVLRGCGSSSLLKTEDLRIEEKVSTFMKKYFHESREIVIIDHNRISTIYQMIHPYVPVVALEYVETNSSYEILGVDCLLLFFDELSTLENDITALKTIKSWSPRARFVLVSNNVTLAMMEVACEFLWKNQIGRAILVHQENAVVRVTKCNPFRKILESVDDKISRDENVFEDFRDIYGYPINEEHFAQIKNAKQIRMTHQLFERRYMRTVLELMNATELGHSEHFTRAFPRYNSKGEPVGIIANFANHLTDVSFTEWILGPINNYYEITYPHVRSDSTYVVVVPKAGLMSQGEKLTLQYQRTVWIVILGAVLFNATAWYLVKKKSSSSKPFWDSVFLLFSLSAQPPRAVRERLIFTGMTIVGMVLTNTFQGRLSSLYAIPMTYKDIDMVEELCQSKLHIDALDFMYANRIAPYGNTLPPCFLKMIKSVSGAEFSLRTTEHHSDRAYIVGYEYALQMVSRRTHHAHNGRPLLHIIDEVVLPNYVGFAVVRWSPYLERMNTVIHRIHAAGLSVHWYAMFKLLTNQDYQPPVTYDRKVLTLDDLTTSFIILVSGLTLSAIIFLGEFI